MITVLGAVDDVADPRVADALHVEFQARPVAADDEMTVAKPTRPSVHNPHLIRTTDHCTIRRILNIMQHDRRSKFPVKVKSKFHKTVIEWCYNVVL